MNKDEIIVPILQAINDLRAEVRDNKREMREENNKRWDENDKRWEEYDINRVNDKEQLFDILLRYDVSISTQLGDKNAFKMKKMLKL